MSDGSGAANQQPTSPSSRAGGTLFSGPPRPQQEGSAWLPWAIAAAAALLLVAGLLLISHRRPAAAANAPQPLDPYASSLAVDQLQMSESTSLSGGKSTFIDGHLRNVGSRTVTGVTVQVMFGNDEQLPPQLETLPLALIRTHEPYVDTQPVSAAPVRPGDEREFRLIFEDIRTNWNQQLPVIRVIHVDLR